MLDSLQVLALSWQPNLQQQNQPEQATINPSPSTPQRELFLNLHS